MNIIIDPNTTFSTGEAAKMLNIEGITVHRVKLLCDKGLVPTTKSEGGFHRIRFGDFDKIIEAHKQVRTVGTKPPTHVATQQDIDQLDDRINRMAIEMRALNNVIVDLEDQVRELHTELGVTTNED